MRFSSRKIVLFICLGLLVSGLPLVHDFLVPPPPTIQGPDNNTAAGNSMTMADIRLFQHQGRQQQVELAAGHAFSDNLDQHILLTTVKMLLTSRSGAVNQIRGDNALYTVSSEEITMTDNIVATFDDLRATAEQMSYYPETRLLAAQGPVTITGEGLRVTGSGLSYDIGSGELAMGDGTDRVRCRLER